MMYFNMSTENKYLIIITIILIMKIIIITITIKISHKKPEKNDSLSHYWLGNDSPKETMASLKSL